MVVDFIYEEDIDIDASKRSGSFAKAYIELPKASEFLYGKFLTMMDGTRRPYMQAPYHEHTIGDDPKKDTRKHFCPKAVDPSAKCPECDAYWEAMKARKKLKEQGDSSSSEFKKLECTIKMYKQKTGGFLLFVAKGGKKIQPLFVKETFLAKAFGRAAIPALDKKEIVGYINELKADGINPFSIKDEVGWLKLWKTGSGLETEFHITLDKEYVQSIVNGKEKKVQQDVERQMEPEIIDTLRAGKAPNLIDVITSGNLEYWSYDETLEYVQKGNIPERCKSKRTNSGEGKKTKTEDDFYSEDFTASKKEEENTPNLYDEDDAPF